MIKKRAGKTCLALVIVHLLTACSADDSRQAKPQRVEMTLNVSKNTNPDRDSRAAPVQVLIYLLSNADNFSNSDYLTLSTGTNPALLTDIHQQQQLILKPGESRTLALEADEEIRYLGIVAAYRNINEAQWNTVYPLHQEQSQSWYQNLLPTSDEPLKLSVTLDKLTVAIEEVN